MKDSLLNLLVFLLVFVGVTVLSLALYGLSFSLVPGGSGLVFASPFAASLLPALLSALVAAVFRSVRRPGRFRITWLLLATAFLLLLTLPLPLIQQMPPLRASDSTPLVPGRFLPLEDGSLLLSSGNAAVLVPQGDGPMTVAADTQYDPLHQRFVFSSGEPKGLGSTGPERLYFQFTPVLASLQTDFLAVYTVLRDSWAQDPLRFWAQAWAVTWLFMGLYFFFSWKTWPLVHGVLVLLLVRLGLSLLVYSFWSIPALADLWLTGAVGAWARVWIPILFLDTAAAALFSMTWLTKPHRRAALP